MNFRSIAQLSDHVLRLAHQLPSDIEVVVGLPRSGLLAANILALYLNVPLADLEGFIEGRCLTSGRRGNFRPKGYDDEAPFLSRPRKALILDDSIRFGGAMREARQRIEEAGLAHEMAYAAVYISPGTEEMVDHYVEVLGAPRVFEWNVLHHPNLDKCCFDIDGVLCRDPEVDENDDGAKYSAFLQNAQPLLLPSYEIGWIVTSRLERYRSDTERWLAQHGIRYKHLMMLDYPDGATRRQMGTHAAFKAEVYRSTDATLFIESSIRQAQEISRLSRRPVLCTDTMQMLYPDSSPRSRTASLPNWGTAPPPLSRRFIKRVRRWIPSPVKSVLRRGLSA